MDELNAFSDDIQIGNEKLVPGWLPRIQDMAYNLTVTQADANGDRKLTPSDGDLAVAILGYLHRTSATEAQVGQLLVKPFDTIVAKTNTPGHDGRIGLLERRNLYAAIGVEPA
jgi:hypothetical protein